MKILDIKQNYKKVIEETVKVIRNGGLVVFPTDTVYGLMVDPTNEKAVKKLLNFKNRWTGKAISVAVLDKKMAMEYVKLSKNDENVYSSLLPGPFTIINNGKHKVVEGIEAENGTLGIRIPDYKYIQDLIKVLKRPVTATSANLAGRRPNYSVEGFLKSLSEKKKEMIDLVVDAGKLPRNKPSTVIDLTGSEIKILRRGDLITGKTNTLISKSEKETERIAEFLMSRVETFCRTSLQKKQIQNPSGSRTPACRQAGLYFDEMEILKQKPLVFLLSGDLGCGKTVFSRKIGRLLGIKEKITSPTFVIYNEYKTHSVSRTSLKKGGCKKFIHADLYKITSEKDLEEINFLDLFSPSTSSGFTVACIEWPENMGKKYLEKLKKKAKIVTVNFSYVDEKTREIKY